jgi:hypothetical protein
LVVAAIGVVIVFAVGALNGGNGSGPTSTPFPVRSASTPIAAVSTPNPPAPSVAAAAPTVAVGPTGFADKLSPAIVEQGILTDDLQALQGAAAAGDLEAMSLYADGLGADTETIDLLLSQLPSWKPANSLVKSWREAMAAFGPAFADLEKGARRSNAKPIERGTKELNSATKLLSKATPKITSFIADTGFSCP